MSIRINYSKDGTKGYFIQTNNSIGAISSTNMNILDQDELNSGGSVGSGWANSGTRFALNFPQPLRIDKIHVMSTSDSGNTYEFRVSNNSTNGVDGTWDLVGSGPFGSGTYMQYIPVGTPTEAVWFRIQVYNGYAGNGLGWYRWIVFGEYANPYIEFWDVDELAPITDNYEDYGVATKESDFTHFRAFKVKNVHPDLQTHSYNMIFDPLKNGGDSLITNYWKFSDKGDLTVPADKVSTLDLTDIPHNGFSPEIRVYSDFTIAQNPGDGYHYWYARVTETA